MGNIVTVNFRNDTLFAIERDDGVFVAPKPICDTLGLAWNKQLERIKRDPILAEGMTMTVLPSVGGPQETILLKIELINGWLFGIDESRVKDEETRQRVLTYKRECHQVLHKHFHGKHMGMPLAKTADGSDDTPESAKLRMVNESRQVFGNQAAAQLWVKLGLPIVPAMLHDPRQLNLLDYSAVNSAPEHSEAA